MAGPIIQDANGIDRLWPFSASKNSHVKTLENSFRTAIAAKDVLEGHQISVRSSGKLTEKGVADEVRSFGRGNIVPALAKGAVAIQRAREAVKAQRAKLTVPLDRDDKVQDFYKRETFRETLRRMPKEQREQMLSRHADNLSPQQIRAVLEHEDAPWESEDNRLVSSKIREALEAHLIQKTHPAAITEITELERAIEYAQPTIDNAAKDIQSTLAMRAGEFSAVVEAEAKANPAKVEGVIVASPPVASSPAGSLRSTPEMDELWRQFDELHGIKPAIAS